MAPNINLNQDVSFEEIILEYPDLRKQKKEESLIDYKLFIINYIGEHNETQALELIFEKQKQYWTQKEKKIANLFYKLHDNSPFTTKIGCVGLAYIAIQNT